ncbi:protein LTO1 homolog isoform X1 [Nothobranchius furzeri]|uniref:protein LTO1 homolog isoform X1 n=1 Tax=Nothobranchius furzeri TaxID=105023 RepID=UPI00390464F8
MHTANKQAEVIPNLSGTTRSRRCFTSDFQCSGTVPVPFGQGRAMSGGADEDLFDNILLADERFRGEGFRDGFERGTRRGLQDGRRHGTSHGARLSSEISFYHGFAITWKCLLHHNTDERSRKRVKALESLLAVIQTVPLADPQSVELQDGTEKLRSKFRQVCSLLNVPMDFKEHFRSAEDMSF